MSTREKIIELLDLLSEEEQIIIHKAIKFLCTYKEAANEREDQAVV